MTNPYVHSSLLLLLVAVALFSVHSNIYSAAAAVDGGGGAEVPWQILTKLNYSSNIRFHPQLLLLVTVPWSGESRSLMKELANAVASDQLRFGTLKLMVIYRNADRMLADSLGAGEGITFFYYHNTFSYKYQGKLRAHNILASVNYVISLFPEELPLKSLTTSGELRDFLDSTDKAIVLFEFCGWIPGLLARGNNNKSEIHIENFTEEFIGTHAAEGMDDRKGTGDDKLNFGTSNGYQKYYRMNQFAPANQSFMKEAGNLTFMSGVSCSLDEFQHFELFLRKFITDARQFLLPPERHRFAVVYDRSLLPLLNIEGSDSWFSAVHFAGCPSCSKVLREGNDLRTVLNYPSPVLELEDDEVEATLPGKGPTALLFVDRSSESVQIRMESQRALIAFRELAQQYKISNNIYEEATVLPGKSIEAGQTSLSTLKRTILHDTMSIVIMNEGKQFTLEDFTSDLQGSSLHEILTYALKRKNEMKLSSVPKDTGFQLLSKDFEIKVVESLPPNTEVQTEQSLGEPLDEIRLRNSDDVYDDKMQAVSSGGQHEEKFNPSYAGYTLLDKKDESLTTRDSSEKSENVHRHMDTTTDGDQDDVKEAKLKEIDANMLKKNFGGSSEKSDPSYTDHILLDKKDESFTTRGSYEKSENVHHHMDTSTDGEQEDGKEAKLKEIDDNKLKKNFGGSSEKSDPSYADRTLPDKKKESLTTRDSSEKSEDVHHRMDTSTDGDQDDGKEAKLKELDDNMLKRNFDGSFFFYDGQSRLVETLTGESNVPTLVIIDPILERHYVLPKHSVISCSLLSDFVDNFLLGKLLPYEKSAAMVPIPVEVPKPPFVNLDFQEKDSIPVVTANTFAESVLGPEHSCHSWDRNVLVLFSNNWCGFCQRMEVVVREVHRAIKGLAKLNMNSSMVEKLKVAEYAEDATLSLPLVYLMDCTQNDCGLIIKPILQKELYPLLLLFPAGRKKNAVPYEGNIAVSDIIKFLSFHGSLALDFIMDKMGYLKDHSSAVEVPNLPLEVLLKDRLQNVEMKPNQMDSPFLIDLHTLPELSVGCILTATEKLLDVHPFDESKILIVKMEQRSGFVGLMINKPIDWDNLEEGYDLIKESPLYFGGPMMRRGMPLVALTYKYIQNQSVEVLPEIYYVDQWATQGLVEEIRAGNHSVHDYAFFFGYSSWGWDQLFHEIAQGAWNISHGISEQLEWPWIR